MRKYLTFAMVSVLLSAGFVQMAVLANNETLMKGNQNVIIDLSALDQVNGNRNPLDLTLSRPNKLLMPSEIMPQSKLHVPSPSGTNFSKSAARPGFPSNSQLVSTFTPPKALVLGNALKSEEEPSKSAKLETKTLETPEAPKINMPKLPEVDATKIEKNIKAEVKKIAEVPVTPPKSKNSDIQIPEAPPPPQIDNSMKPAALIPKAKKDIETATLPEAEKEIAKNSSIQIEFPDQSVKLANSAQKDLLQLINFVGEAKNKRLQLMAYAKSDNLSTSRARRLSLSRALAVRSFLIANGIRSTRIDVRALGSKVGSEPGNRVDINVIER